MYSHVCGHIFVHELAYVEARLSVLLCIFSILHSEVVSLALV